MGRVYLGLSAGGRQVAVKVIRADLATDPEFRARFRREVAAARLVSGLYTAAVIDADTEGQRPWLATAYISAPSLATAVQDGGPLPPASLRGLAAALAEGLSAIHAAGLVHRDLKPTNVLLATDGPRVIDFGIAYAAEASALTGTNVVVGSPGYLSPEQAEARRAVGPATDVFSLGAVLCYAATGHGPWGTGSTVAMIFRVVHGEPDITGVPDEIRSLVTRCLVKEPGQRPTAAEILAELGDPELLDGWLRPAAPAPVPALPEQSVTVALPPKPTTLPPPAGGDGPTTAPPRPAPLSAPSADLGTPPFISAGIADTSAPTSGIPVPPAGLTTPRPGGLPSAWRRRWRLAAGVATVVAAAAVAVPLLVTSPGGGGPSSQASGGSSTASYGASQKPVPPPALAGVYSAYGVKGPNSVAAGTQHVWVLNGFDDGQNGSVAEIDARTGALVKKLGAAGYGFKATFNDTAGIIDDGANVWVGNQNSITEIKASDGSLVRTLTIPASVNLHGWFTALVRAGTHLWAVTPDTCRPYCVSPKSGFYASFVEFNASDGSYVRSITRNTLQDPLALASDGTHVWLVGSEVNGSDTNASTAGTVAELSADDGTQLWSAPVTVYHDPSATTYDSLAYADGRLWVANGKSVTELDASTGKVIQVLSGAQYKFDGSAAIAAAGDKLLVVNSSGNSVTEIDARTGKLLNVLDATRYHFNGPTAIAVAGNHAWIINSPRNAPGSVVELTL
jgi:serine/threonine protein kinase